MTIIDTSEKIDLLLTDVMMPGPINGRQLAVEAPSRRPSLKVLYTSGYSENTMVDDAILEPASPCSPSHIAKSIWPG